MEKQHAESFKLEFHPVAWCSVAPRESFSALERSRVLKRIDDAPVWSISCFFIRKEFRKQGLSVKILEAIDHLFNIVSRSKMAREERCLKIHARLKI
jgi:hypothetical protein